MEDNKNIYNNKIKQIFKTYPKKELIAEKILQNFIEIAKKNDGFLIDYETGNSKNKKGIISDCMALSTLLELNSMNANIVPYHKEMFKLIENILNSIYRKDIESNSNIEKYICYDATPYVFNNNDLILESYTETMSKVLITFTDLRDYIIDNKLNGKKIKYSINFKGENLSTSEMLLDKVDEVIVDTIKMINVACLKNGTPFKYTIEDDTVERNKLSSEVNYRGWTFKSVNEEEQKDYVPSIYYTYHISNAYLSFYQSFEKYFYDEFGDIIERDFSINEYDKKAVEKNKLNTDFFTRNLQIITEFRKKIVSTGRYFEYLINQNNADIAFDFLNKDFTPVSLEMVMNSQDNNYVINTLLVLATLINSGVDDDYWSKNKKEYFYDQINYSLNNIKKVYFVLKRLNREEFIDSYSLVLDEKYPTSCNNIIKELRRRCKNIELYDLVPLYCNTYSVVSKYLVEFPQKEMQDIYNMIYEDRMKDMNNNEEGIWLWSNTGFNMNNNLYYVFALENFYNYYDEYEKPLLNADDIRIKYDNLEKTYEIEKSKEIAEIRKQYNKELVSKDEEIKRVLGLYENKKSKLDEEVLNLLNKNIDNVMTKYLEDLVHQAKMHAIISWKIEYGDYTGIEEYENDIYKREQLISNYPKAQLLYEMSYGIDVLSEIRPILERNKNLYIGKTPEEMYSDVDKIVKKNIKEKTKAAR